MDLVTGTTEVAYARGETSLVELTVPSHTEVSETFLEDVSQEPGQDAPWVGQPIYPLPIFGVA